MWIGADRWTGIVHKDWIHARFKKTFSAIENQLDVLKEEYEKDTVYPAQNFVFRALEMSPNAVNVVILGQDPYHCGRANGYSFDNNIRHEAKKANIAPSLRRILKKIELETGSTDAFGNENSYLEHLPPQGVLLLNTALTVKKGEPGSHLHIWEEFTKELLTELTKKPMVVILWGKKAQYYKEFISEKSIVIEGAHPSPFTRDQFFETDCFKLITSVQW